MPITSSEKNKIRVTLLLELNSAFVKVSKHYKEYGKDEHRVYGFDFQYRSTPSWETYASLLTFAQTIKGDLADLKPRDMIDIQSFIWVLGSDEYR